MLEALSGSVQASALDLSQNGIATLEFQDQHRRLHHVTTLLVGRLGDLWEWTVLNHQHKRRSVSGRTHVFPHFAPWKPSLSHGQPQFVPRTNGGRKAAQNVYVLKIYVPVSLAKWCYLS